MQEKNIIPISEDLINKSKDYIFPISIGNKIGTCFLINTLCSLTYLCINYDLISQEFIASEGEIDIIGRKIKLDKKRMIIDYKRQCIFIQIFKTDGIDEKFQLDLETDLLPDDYINIDTYLFAYYKKDNLYKRGYIPGRIVNIDNYKIFHEFNTKYLLSVSPICIVIDNKLKIIGVQLENPDFKEYKYMSYGYLLKYIFKELNIEFKENGNNIPKVEFSLNNDSLLSEFSKDKHYSFYTLEQYKNSIKDLHIKLSEYYKEQNEQNFNTHYNRINRTEYKKYLKNLYYFKNINNNQLQIFNDLEIAKNLNKILLSNDYNMINKFSYFIAGFIYVLNTYSEEVGCQFKNDGDILYTRMKFTLEDLIELDKNIEKIITFKTFLSNVTSLEHLSGKINALIMNFKNYFSFYNYDKFDTKVYIEHHYDILWKASCFSTMPHNDKIFNLFSFFKVKEVKINFEEKYSEIKLELVGKNEIFEEKFGEKGKANINYNVIYDEHRNIIQILNPNYH